MRTLMTPRAVLLMSVATLTLAEGTGPRPRLPAPSTHLVPTVHIAPAKGWPSGLRPAAAEGLVVESLARGLDHPRWLYVLPNGDVLVAETVGMRPENSTNPGAICLKASIPRSALL